MRRVLVAVALLQWTSSAAASRGPDPEEAAVAPRRAPVPRRPRAPSAPRVLVTVADGQTLSEIAAANGVSVRRLAAENGIDSQSPVRVGQRLRIPQTRAARRPPPPPCRNPAVKFLRVASNEAADVVLTRCGGRADPDGRDALSRLSRSLRADETRDMHPRLLQMLQKVAERWPGRRLLVISGYRRGRPGHESNHTKGRAIDFRVEGVSNGDLRDFCRRFDAAGVGFYPNSVFVHLDVRDSGRAFWVDYSGPGEAPRYGPWRPEPAADRPR
jgi:uncharacterized protein YcbK (DUF882 family)